MEEYFAVGDIFVTIYAFFTTIINVWWVKYCSKSHLDMDLNAFVIGYQQHERESRQNMTKKMKNKQIQIR